MQVQSIHYRLHSKEAEDMNYTRREIAVVTRGILLMLVLILMIKILCNPLRIL